MGYVASISYGKDSLAMLEAIKILGYPLDRIITAEVWATDTIQADLPPMIEFKEYADKVIKERYGIEVEHFRAKDKNGDNITYENVFYRELGSRGKKKREQDGKESNIYGFPIVIGTWCNSKLKVATLQEATKNIGGGTTRIYGFPMMKGNWCNSLLKMGAIRQAFHPFAKN